MNKTTTIALTLMMIVAAASIGVYYEAITYIYYLNSDTVTLAQTYSANQFQYKKEEATRHTVSSAGDSIQTAQQFIIQPNQELNVVQTIEGLADTAKLAHTTDEIELDPAPITVNVANTEMLHVIITTTGNWSSSMYFLSLIQTLPYNIVMNKVSLTAIGDTSATSSAGVWTGSFDISILKYKDNN